MGESLLSSRQGFRAIGGPPKHGAPGQNFEAAPRMLANLPIAAQVIWFNDDAEGVSDSQSSHGLEDTTMLLSFA
eukprot:8478438-Karenia_brevis.AAC.1